MARAKTPPEGDAAVAEDRADPAQPVVFENAAPPPVPPAQDVPNVPEPARSGGAGFAALALGGALAAVFGFVLSRAVPGGWPTASVAPLEAQLAAQEDEITALKAALSERGSPPDLSPLAEGLDALHAQVMALEGAVAALPEAAPPPDLSAITSRLDALEARPAVAAPAPVDLSAVESRLAALETAPPPAIAGDPAAAQELTRALAAMRADLAAQKEAAAKAAADVAAAAEAARAALAKAEEDAARLRTEAEAAVALARRDAALGRLAAAVDSGAPYAAAAADLAAAGAVLPEVLASQAETGVPTLLSLQAAYPEAARAALEASLRADMGETTMERIGTFLRTQTGARSLEPREGTDPDAVLSRAEAAVAAGDLATALTEIAALPEPGRAAMEGWTIRASARVGAIAALAELSAAP